MVNTSANILISYMFRHRGCHPQGVFRINGIQAEHANLGMHRAHWNYYSIEILKYRKLGSIKLHSCIKRSDSSSRYKFIAVFIMCGACKQACLDLCDPKRSCPLKILGLLILYI